MLSAVSTSLVLELIGGLAGGCFALWLATQSLSSPRGFALTDLAPLTSAAISYLQRPGLFSSIGLLLLRLSIGVMMIHHGQEKLADPWLPHPPGRLGPDRHDDDCGLPAHPHRWSEYLCPGTGGAVTGRQPGPAAERSGAFLL